MPTKSKKGGLQEIVGEQVYSAWVEMLKRLVPQGRTHRLAPTIAAMLQYAADVAHEKYGDNPEEGTAAHRLFTSGDEDPESAE